MNTAHLNEYQLAAALSGIADAGVRQHLAECDLCRTEQQRLAAAIADMRHISATAAQQPDWFWTRQRAQAAARIQPPRRWFAVPALAACALVVLSLVLLGRGIAPQPTVTKAAVDSDDLVLRQIESNLSQSAPQALAPAALLSEDFARAAEQSKSSSKEKGNVL